MTHPTIEAAQKAIAEAYEPGAHNSKAEAKAAARVILSAPPSEAEVYAALNAVSRKSAIYSSDMEIALIAFLAQRRKELGVE